MSNLISANRQAGAMVPLLGFYCPACNSTGCIAENDVLAYCPKCKLKWDYNEYEWSEFFKLRAKLENANDAPVELSRNERYILIHALAGRLRDPNIKASAQQSNSQMLTINKEAFLRP